MFIYKITSCTYSIFVCCSHRTHIEVLNASREEESMLPFQCFMLNEHTKNLRAEIVEYEKSINDDVIINVGKEDHNVEKEIYSKLTERQKNIISAIMLNPTITIPELAEKMSGKKTITTRTIERDLAYLQAKGLLRREGGRKNGKWVI